MVQERGTGSAGAINQGGVAGAFAGVVAGLLWIFGQMAYDNAPELGSAEVAEIIRFYAEQATTHRIGVTVAGLVFGLFLVYLVRLWSLTTQSEAVGGSMATMMLTAGTILGALYLLAATIATLPLSRDLAAINAGTVESLFSLRALGQQLVFSMFPRAVFLAATGMATLKYGLFPRWLGILALFFAVVAVVGGLRFLFPISAAGYGVADGLAILSNYTLPLWIIMSSIAILTRRRRSAKTARRLGDAAFAR